VSDATRMVGMVVRQENGGRRDTRNEVQPVGATIYHIPGFPAFDDDDSCGVCEVVRAPTGGEEGNRPLSRWIHTGSCVSRRACCLPLLWTCHFTKCKVVSFSAPSACAVLIPAIGPSRAQHVAAIRLRLPARRRGGDRNLKSCGRAWFANIAGS
jgi:hypothetical protein